MPNARIRHVLAIAALVGAIGCGQHMTFEDGSTLPDGGAPDVWTGTRPLFATCGADQQCAFASGVQCLTTFPGGLCVHRCSSDVQCGTTGVCAFNVCLPRCQTGSGMCTSIGGACVQIDATRAYCEPSCCASTGRVPPPTDFDPTRPLPQSNCPNGSVVSSIERGNTGDVTTCFRGCNTDSECRTGYECDHEQYSGGPYASGRCAPINCLETGRVCPSGYACHPITGSMMFGTCGR
jgi:hypothetical protein